MLFSLGLIEIILVGQGGIPPPSPPLAYFVDTDYTVAMLFKGYFPESTILSFWNVVIVSLFFCPIIVYHVANAIQTLNGMHFSVYESSR